MLLKEMANTGKRNSHGKYDVLNIHGNILTHQILAVHINIWDIYSVTNIFFSVYEQENKHRDKRLKAELELYIVMDCPCPVCGF